MLEDLARFWPRYRSQYEFERSQSVLNITKSEMPKLNGEFLNLRVTPLPFAVHKNRVDLSPQWSQHPNSGKEDFKSLAERLVPNPAHNISSSLNARSSLVFQALKHNGNYIIKTNMVPVAACSALDKGAHIIQSDIVDAFSILHFSQK